MKQKISFLISILIFSSLLIPACVPNNAKTNNCAKNICLKLEIREPIKYNSPVVVLIEVKTEIDINDLHITLGPADPYTQFIGQHLITQDAGTGLNYKYVEWYQDTLVGETYNYTATVQFPIEGFFTLILTAVEPVKFAMTSTSTNVFITKGGGTANPTIEAQPLITVPSVITTPTLPTEITLEPGG